MITRRDIEDAVLARVQAREISSVEWTHEEKRYRLAESDLGQVAPNGDPKRIRSLARFDGGDTGWRLLAEWRASEDGPTFAGLANVMFSAINANCMYVGISEVVGV
jgi:hypothetical protein